MGQLHGSDGRGSGLVERERELAQMSALMMHARAGRGSVGFVQAPAGLGKTTLLREACAIGRAEGLEVLAARGSEMEREVPFGVTRQLLAPALLARRDSDAAELFQGAAGLARPVFETASSNPRGATDADTSFAVLDGLYWLLAGLAARAPLVISVDDVHWADAPSARFLTFLLRRLEGLSVALLIAGRPDEDTGFSVPLEEAIFSAGAEQITPVALSGPGASEMLGARLLDVPDAEFAAACQRVTRGNPFYLNQLTIELADRGLRPISEHARAVDEFAPRSIARAVLRRASGLGDGAVSLMEAIAVLGDGADRACVAALAGLELGTLADAADALVRASILSPGDALSFAHPIVRAAVYADRPPTARAARHAAAVEVLRAEGAAADRVAAQLLLTAPDAVADTAPELERAATEAIGRGAPDAAVLYFARALDEQLSPRKRVELALSLGLAADAAGHGDAEALLRQALEFGEEPVQRVDAALALARFMVTRGRTERAAGLLASLGDELHEAAPSEAQRLELELLLASDIDLSLRSSLDGRLGRAAGRIQGVSSELEPLRVAHRAIEALMRGESADEAAELAQRALSSSQLRAAAVGRTMLRPILIWVLICAERYGSAAEFCEEVIDRARRDGSAHLFIIASLNRSVLAVRAGSLADAEAEVRNAIDVVRLNGWQPFEIMALTALMDASVDRGDPEAALAELERTGVDIGAIGSAQAAGALFSRGRLRIALGQVQGGCQDLLECGRRFTSWGMLNPAVFAWRSEAALALASMGDGERARQLASEEVGLARRWGTPRALGIALRAQALVGSPEQTLQILGEAVQVLEDTGARLERARALIDLGAALRRTGQRTEARGPLRAGVELAQQSGADTLAGRGRTELRAAGARLRTPLRTGLDALTPSERRIVEMAAAGLSNPAVAQALFLTIKTIEMHLTSAYRKLGVASRAELSAVLAEDRAGATPVGTPG